MKKEKTNFVLIKVDKELHKKLKIRAINENKTLQQLTNEILEKA